MEINKAIRVEYFSALSGNILDKNSNAITIYDAFAIPEDVIYPYILLSAQTASQLVIKRCKRYTTTMLVDIVTGSQSVKGRSESEDIAEQIESIINPDSGIDLDLTSNGYQLGNTIKESDTYLTNKNNTYYIVRKLLTYKHLTVKL